ncbi:hypothetical protein N9N67_05310 [Bacteriovoracaceae bacterium]|nr:hypothetical protein [Bacteriovoracaceae bacterium]
MKIFFSVILIFLFKVDISFSQDSLFITTPTCCITSEYEFRKKARKMMYFYTLLATNEKEYKIHELKKLGKNDKKNSFEKVNFAFLESDIQSENYVNLPEPINSNLIDYFKGLPKKKSYDCNAFAHHLNGVEYEKDNFDYEKWNITLISDNINAFINSDREFKIGDTIILANSYEDFTHAAVYISNGVYISKFADVGPIIFTTLDEMKNGFGGNQIYLISPVQE